MKLIEKLQFNIMIKKTDVSDEKR